MNRAIDLMARGLLPDPVIRLGIRRLLSRRLEQEDKGNPAARLAAKMELIGRLREEPIAVLTDRANEQHYEVPPGFFEKVLGPHLKYSGCYWPEAAGALADAEAASLKQVCERAGLADGMEILELGCGWGSLTLWMAKHYPRSRVLAVSNSSPQREFILARCRERGPVP